MKTPSVPFWWVVVFVALGLLLGWVAVKLVQPILEAPAFRRQNYRNSELGIGSGLALVVAYLVVGAISATVDVFTGRDQTPDASWVIAIVSVSVPLASVIGFALLGLVDDLAGTGIDRGFAGHLGALRSGRLTTGSLKFFGGGALALIATQHAANWWRWLPAAAAVALGANLANLLDRAPGRSLKVAVAALVVTIASTAGAFTLVGPPAACLLGVLLALLPSELAERSMLGDTGANAAGASVAFVVVERLQSGPTSLMVIFVVFLLGLNLASEVVSFSSVIDQFGPLRWFDRLGATPERKANESTSNGPSSTGAQR